MNIILVVPELIPYLGEFVKVRVEGVPNDTKTEDVSAWLAAYGKLRDKATRSYYDGKSKKRFVEMEFMLNEDAQKAFGALRNNIPFGPKCTLTRVAMQGLGRQNEQEMKRTLRIRAGGLSRGSAIIVCSSDVDAQQVQQALDGEILGCACVRARISNKGAHEVRLDDLTEAEDEATLFSEFKRLGITQLLHPDRCIVLHTAPWIHKDSLEEASGWFRSTLRTYGEIQKIDVRVDSKFSFATVVFRTEQEALSAHAGLNRRTDLFDGILTLPCDVEIFVPNFISLLPEVANKFQKEITALLSTFNDNNQATFTQAILTPRASVQIKQIGDGKRTQMSVLSQDKREIQNLQNSLSSFSTGVEVSLPASTAVAAAFTQGLGKKFLQKLQSQHKVVVKHHLVGNQCVIFGPQVNTATATADLTKFTKSIENYVVDSVPLSVSHYALLQRSLSQKLEALRAPGDNTTSFSYSRDQQVLSVNGEQAFVDHIIQKIEAFRIQSVGGNLAPPSTQFGNGGCVVCGTSTNINPERDRLRVCGHTLCPQCLHDHFLAATSFPIQCPGGNEQSCVHSITLRDAERVLDLDERTEVAQNCVKYMLQRQRKYGVGRRYRVCPTPGCAQLYVATKEKLKCDTCGVSFCLTCARATGKDPVVVRNHEGETCAEYMMANGASSTNNNNVSLTSMMSSIYNSTLPPANQNQLLSTIVPAPSSLADGGTLGTYGMKIIFFEERVMLKFEQKIVFLLVHHYQHTKQIPWTKLLQVMVKILHITIFLTTNITIGTIPFGSLKTMLGNVFTV